MPVRLGVYLLCVGMLALACCRDETVPTAETIQTAYDRESSEGSRLHDRGLRLVGAKCYPGAAGRYLCQVTFLSRSDPTERLYFDVIAVAREGAAWALKSGLCKR